MSDYQKLSRELSEKSKHSTREEARLIDRAKDAIIELLGMHALDMSEIVRLRRQMEAEHE